MKMKTYVCRRCGTKFEGRLDYCPRCDQHFVYKRKDGLYDALGRKVELDKHNHIRKIYPNNKLPK